MVSVPFQNVYLLVAAFLFREGLAEVWGIPTCSGELPEAGWPRESQPSAYDSIESLCIGVPPIYTDAAGAVQGPYISCRCDLASSFESTLFGGVLVCRAVNWGYYESTYLVQYCKDACSCDGRRSRSDPGPARPRKADRLRDWGAWESRQHGSDLIKAYQPEVVKGDGPSSRNDQQCDGYQPHAEATYSRYCSRVYRAELFAASNLRR